MSHKAFKSPGLVRSESLNHFRNGFPNKTNFKLGKEKHGF